MDLAMKKVGDPTFNPDVEMAESLYVAWLAHRMCIVEDADGVRRYKYSMRKLASLIVPENHQKDLSYMLMLSGYDHCLQGLVLYLKERLPQFKDAQGESAFIDYYKTRATQLVAKAESIHG